jgi:hypothetical protein
MSFANPTMRPQTTKEIVDCGVARGGSQSSGSMR